MNAEELARDVLLRLVEENEQYCAAVRAGIAQADRGELIDDEEVKRWLEGRKGS